MARRMPPITPEKVEVLGVATAGVICDQPGHILPSAAWTNGGNIRFRNNKAFRFPGDVQVFGTPSVVPYQAFNVPGLSGESFWIYLGLAAAYVYDGAHTNITRVVGGAYTTVNGRDWSWTLLAGVPILTNFADVPQYWTGLSAGSKLANLPNWDANRRCKRIVALGSYVFALNITDTGTKQPHKVLVSHKADPGSVPSSWDVTNDAVDAVEFELIGDGEIMDGLPLGDIMVVYKEASTHTIRFQGGDDIWKRDLLFLNRGILAPRCVSAFKEGTMHFVATQDDLIIHSGTPGSNTSIVEGVNKDRIFNTIDVTNAQNSFCVTHPTRPELWFCYPEAGQTYPSKAFVYNYIDKVPSFRDFTGLSLSYGKVATVVSGTWDSDSGSWDSDGEPWEAASFAQLIATDPAASKFYQLENGLDYHGTVFTAFLERVALAFEGKYVRFGQRVLLDRVWPKITGAGRWTIKVGMQETRDGAITWSSPIPFDPNSPTPYIDIDPPLSGRLPAIRFENTEAVATGIEGYDLRLSPLGEF